MDEQQEQVDDRQAQLLEHNNLTTEVKGIKKIETADQYRRVAAVRATLRAGIEYFEDRHRPNITRWHEGHKQALADLAKDQATAKEGVTYSGKLLADYDTEQEILKRKRQLEEEARLNKEAEEQKKRMIDLAKEVGDKELVKEMKAAPVVVEPVVVVKETPSAKETGVSYREDWAWEATDETKIPREYLCMDSVKIGKIVRALKGSTKIPGIRVFSVKVPIQKNQGWR